MNYKKIAKVILKNYAKVKNGTTTTATTNGKQYRYSKSDKRRVKQGSNIN